MLGKARHKDSALPAHKTWWWVEVTDLNLLDGLLPLADGFQILLRDFREQGLVLALVLPHAIASIKDLLIIRQVREGGLRALLRWENGKKAREV